MARARIGVITDRATASDPFPPVEDRQPLRRAVVAAAEDETVGVDDRCRANELLVRPERRAGGRGGGTEDAPGRIVEDGTLLDQLHTLGARRCVVVDQVGLDVAIPLEEGLPVHDRCLATVSRATARSSASSPRRAPAACRRDDYDRSPHRIGAADLVCAGARKRERSPSMLWSVAQCMGSPGGRPHPAACGRHPSPTVWERRRHEPRP